MLGRSGGRERPHGPVTEGVRYTDASERLRPPPGPVAEGMSLAITLWFVVVGSLLITMALSESFLSRLPLTTSLLYLIVGVALGPTG